MFSGRRYLLGLLPQISGLARLSLGVLDAGEQLIHRACGRLNLELCGEQTQKRDRRSGPFWVVNTLENDLSRQLHCASVIREDFLRVIERCAGNVLKARAGRIARTIYVIYSSRLILRMIEDVPGLRAQFDRITVVERDALVDRQINIVDRPYRKRVACRIRQGPLPRLNVVCIWIYGRIADDITTTLDGRHCSPRSRHTVWIDNDSVDDGAIAIQIGIGRGEYSGILRSFVSIDRRDEPIAQHVLQEEITRMFVGRNVV